jgi:hypothetical protein
LIAVALFGFLKGKPSQDEIPGRDGQPLRRASWVIMPDMTILDIISENRETEKIFKQLEAELGVCICCQGLFLSLREAAERFGFHMESVMAEINTVICDRGE